MRPWSGGLEHALLSGCAYLAELYGQTQCNIVSLSKRWSMLTETTFASYDELVGGVLFRGPACGTGDRHQRRRSVASEGAGVAKNEGWRKMSEGLLGNGHPMMGESDSGGD